MKRLIEEIQAGPAVSEGPPPCDVQLIARPRSPLADRESGEVHRLAVAGVRGAGSQLPYHQEIQRLFGPHDVGRIRAHTGVFARSACTELGAAAYATGNDIAFDGRPSLFTAAHEAAHVVQQRGGVQLKGGVGQVGDRFEREADAVAQRVVSGCSAESLVRRYTGPERREPNVEAGSPVVQRLSYLNLRGIDSHYADERVVPRPSLRAAVVAAVTNLKNAEGELEAARLRGDQVEIDRLEEVVEHQLLFLRSQDIDVDIGVAFDESTLDHRLVEYDSSEDEQAATRVNVRGGKLYRELLQTPVDTEHSSTFHNGLDSEIFVMGTKGELHMASHKIGKYHHSSLLAGQPVAAAGTMTVNTGEITYLDNKSGHYRPGKREIIQVLHRLMTAGELPLDRPDIVGELDRHERSTLEHPGI